MLCIFVDDILLISLEQIGKLLRFGFLTLYKPYAEFERPVSPVKLVGNIKSILPLGHIVVAGIVARISFIITILIDQKLVDS